jgi:hypothetical protein
VPQPVRPSQQPPTMVARTTNAAADGRTTSRAGHAVAGAVRCAHRLRARPWPYGQAPEQELPGVPQLDLAWQQPCPRPPRLIHHVPATQLYLKQKTYNFADEANGGGGQRAAALCQRRRWAPHSALQSPTGSPPLPHAGARGVSRGRSLAWPQGAHGVCGDPATGTQKYGSPIPGFAPSERQRGLLQRLLPAGCWLARIRPECLACWDIGEREGEGEGGEGAQTCSALMAVAPPQPPTLPTRPSLSTRSSGPTTTGGSPSGCAQRASPARSSARTCRGVRGHAPAGAHLMEACPGSRRVRVLSHCCSCRAPHRALLPPLISQVGQQGPLVVPPPDQELQRGFMGR